MFELLLGTGLDARQRRFAETAHRSGVALLSIYPTVRFLRWRRHPNPAEAPAVRRVLHLELIGVVLILYFAASIAR